MQIRKIEGIRRASNSRGNSQNVLKVKKTITGCAAVRRPLLRWYCWIKSPNPFAKYWFLSRIKTLVSGRQLHWPAEAVGTPWPWVSSTTITQSEFDGEKENHKWSNAIIYGGLTWVDAPTDHPPQNLGRPQYVYPWSTSACQGSPGAPYTGCKWTKDRITAPTLTTNCYILDGETWEMPARSLCQYTSVYKSWYGGADATAYCAVFGVMGPDESHILTPWGSLDANVVANSGSQYCSKGTLPSTPCNVTMPDGGIIDHGIVSPSGVKTMQSTLTTECGANPTVQISNSKLVLGPGVTSQLVVTPQGGGKFGVQSNLVTSNATPGAYQAASILTVMPQ